MLQVVLRFQTAARAVKFEQRGERQAWTQPAGHIKCTHAAMAGRMCRALVLPMALLLISGQVPVIARSSRSRPSSALQGALKSTFLAPSLSVALSLAMPVSQPKQAMRDIHWPWAHGGCPRTTITGVLTPHSVAVFGQRLGTPRHTGTSMQRRSSGDCVELTRFHHTAAIVCTACLFVHSENRVINAAC
jgi:hypothetical protein